MASPERKAWLDHSDEGRGEGVSVVENHLKHEFWLDFVALDLRFEVSFELFGNFVLHDVKFNRPLVKVPIAGLDFDDFLEFFRLHEVFVVLADSLSCGF